MSKKFWRVIFNFESGQMEDLTVEAARQKQALKSALNALNEENYAHLHGVPYSARVFKQGALCFEIGDSLLNATGVLNGTVTTKDFMFVANETNYNKLNGIKPRNIRKLLRGTFKSALDDFIAISYYRSQGWGLSQLKAEQEALLKFQSVMDQAGLCGIHFEKYETLKGGSNES